MSGKPRLSVPDAVWVPIAKRIADAHKITVEQLRHGEYTLRIFIPRAKFWRELKALPEGYSFAAIAAISGHDHTTVRNAMTSATVDQDYDAAMARADKRALSGKVLGPRLDLTGQIFGQLTVTGPAPEPPPVRTAKRYHRYRWWNCSCACGGTRVVTTYKLSCGDAFHCTASHHRKPAHTVQGGAAGLQRIREAHTRFLEHTTDKAA